MNQNSKIILLFISLITLGIICGAVIFIPIFDDTFMGLFMGFLIGLGVWLTMKPFKNKNEK